MDRNIPKHASEAIDFYVRTIYSVLKSNSDTRLSGFEEAHSALNSVLHHRARSNEIDFNALVYAVLRLPGCVRMVSRVVMGQHEMMFKEQGYTDIENWTAVSARARRRYCLYDGERTLACFITSRSDIDDLIPVLTAFQIEWNKLHTLLEDVAPALLSDDALQDETTLRQIASETHLEYDDLARLCSIWGAEAGNWLREIRKRTSGIRVRLLDSSLIQYMRSAKKWLANILTEQPEIRNRPIYFVSSNTHSLTNMISGYVAYKEAELVSFMKKQDDRKLFLEWKGIESGELSASRENLLYYVLKKYQATPEGRSSADEQLAYEQQSGISRIASIHAFDIEAQLIDLSRVNPDRVDPRIRIPEMDRLIQSRAFIFNIDYPLGMTAYNILSKVSEEFEDLRGVYIMGKAASLNGIYGDVIIPSVIQDMHSRNTYLVSNAFTSADIEPWLTYGSILAHQRAVTVLGTFLQNHTFIEEMYRGGYTDIEMEAGPFLSAVSEIYRANRHPVDQIVSLNKMKLPIGILHYVSDTPMTKGRNLGAGTLSYFGMDSTYATSIAILRKIFSDEAGGLTGRSAGEFRH